MKRYFPKTELENGEHKRETGPAPDLGVSSLPRHWQEHHKI
jgi:hypothetical protein